MSYESWRISFQSSEQAARAAYANMEALRAELREAWSAVESKAGWEWKKRAEQAEARADKLQAEVERLQEVVRPKREDECLTLDHWRMRAYDLEANWSRCSRACADEQTKREQAEARAEQLAKALREATVWLLADYPETAKRLRAPLRYQEEGK